MEQTQFQKLHERVQALEERDVARSKRPTETTPEATPPSQRRSSVASTELLQPKHVLTAPASYPVDAITESQHCHLMMQWQNFKVKVASALFDLLNPTQLFTVVRFQKDMLG